ncbi:hypothetical protein BGW37DRAFT_498058 [Umbelopsis sp. PMI_123]|nr:hypothetical protein BGW37DRAFT_498058 [Umbelopsis sp. PMI_123]
MSSFKSIAVIGGSGNIGQFIVNALLDAKVFSTIKVLTRLESAKAAPEKLNNLKAKGAQVVAVDLTNEDAVADALQGADAVISVTSTDGLNNQYVWIKAAVRAGVKRFLPSEYGLNTQTTPGPIFDKKRAIQREIEKNGLEYTYVFTSLFADETIIPYLGFDVKEGAATLVGDSSVPLSLAYRKDIAAFVVEILKNPSVSRNKALQIVSTRTSFDGIVERFKAKGHPLKVSRITVEEAQKIIDDNPGTATAFFKFLQIRTTLGQLYFETDDNALFPNVKVSSIDVAVEEAIEAAKQS